MMKRFVIIPRTVMGLLFVAGPIATALHLVPEPVLPHKAAGFVAALAATGYMLPLLRSTEIVGGLMLLSGALAPLGLVVLAPVIVNIALFHLFLVPRVPGPAIMVCVLELMLAWQYRRAFAGLFRIPAPSEPRVTEFGAGVRLGAASGESR